jgi:putative addiction module killer protein
MSLLEIRHYQTALGRYPVLEWLSDLRDTVGHARISARLDKLAGGLLGDWRSVGNGVCELRINHGPGYRIYYAREGQAVILLLCAGTKHTQHKDIERAYAYWKDYKARASQRAVSNGGFPAE